MAISSLQSLLKDDLQALIVSIKRSPNFLLTYFPPIEQDIRSIMRVPFTWKIGTTQKEPREVLVSWAELERTVVVLEASGST